MSKLDWRDESKGTDLGIHAEFWALALMLVIVLVGVVLSFAAPQPAAAHPGGLAADGCHNDRKRGGRHCHRATAPKRETRQAASRTTAYRNCTEARAAGVAPVKRGQPGYGRHLDRDNDGIGCE